VLFGGCRKEGEINAISKACCNRFSPNCNSRCNSCKSANLNLNAQDLGNKAIEHIAQGNLTQEHISQDINATKEQFRKEATEQINEGLNVTAKEVEQRAREELKNQINQKAQQPGFESIFALLGLMGIAFALGRRN
jgi:single-stranded DNA-specific DHH superfamily exonuclease